MLMRTRRLMIALLGLALVTIGTAESGWPTQPIEIVVPAAPGGGSDAVARMIGELVSDAVGQRTIINNITGASGGRMMDYMAGEAADGHTIGLFTVSRFVPMIEGVLPYGVEDFVPVVFMTLEPNWIVSRSDDERFTTIDDILAFARENPGQLTIGGSGSRSTDDLIIQKLAAEEELEVIYVPFDGTAPAAIALLGGHIDLITGRLSSVIDHVEAGNFALHLHFHTEEIEFGGDLIPSANTDLGHEGGYPVHFRSFAVHSDTPADVIVDIRRTVVQAMENERFQQWLSSNAIDLVPQYGDRDPAAIWATTYVEMQRFFESLPEED